MCSFLWGKNFINDILYKIFIVNAVVLLKN